MAQRRWRRWSALLLVGLIAVLGVAYLTAPRLVVRVLDHQQPVPLGAAAVLTGAGMDQSHPAALEITTPPGVAHAVLAGASGRWIPRRLIGTGQTCWGTLPLLPGLGWELRVREGTAPPRILLHPSARELGEAVARLLQQSVGDQWTCSIRYLQVHEAPAAQGPAGTRRFAFQLSGDVDVRSARQTTRFSVLRASGAILIAPPRIRVLCDTFSASLPQLGSDEVILRAVVESQANQWLERQLAGKIWPEWLPLDAQVDIDCGTLPRLEL